MLKPKCKICGGDCGLICRKFVGEEKSAVGKDSDVGQGIERSVPDRGVAGSSPAVAAKRPEKGDPFTVINNSDRLVRVDMGDGMFAEVLPGESWSEPGLRPSGKKKGEVVAALKAAVEAVPAQKEKSGGRGRPAKHSDKPWEAEGVSRKTWYKRNKGDGGGEAG